MTCTQIEDLMARHIEETITPEETAKLDAHMLECEACSQYFMLFTDIAATPVTAVAPQDFTANVMAKVYPVKERSTALGWSLVCAASAMLLAFAVFIIASPQYFANLLETNATIAAINDAALNFGSMLSNDILIESTVGIGALLFAILLGLLLSILHKDEGMTTA